MTSSRITESSNCVLTLSCIDRKGIVAGVAGFLRDHDCNIIESAQYFDPYSRHFFLRMQFDTASKSQRRDISSGFAGIASTFEMEWRLHDANYKPHVLVMVSRFGHCLNDILYRNRMRYLNMKLVAVVSNHDTWRDRVESEDIPFYHLSVDKETKAHQERELLKIIERNNVDLVVLARYMQVLSDGMCKLLRGQLINIHHSFLPSFKGAKPYHQAFDQGVKLIGATAHYVTSELDEGPIIEQGVARINHSMSPEEIIAVGRDVECQVLANAMAYHLDHRILLNGNRTVVFK